MDIFGGSWHNGRFTFGEPGGMSASFQRTVSRRAASVKPNVAAPQSEESDAYQHLHRMARRYLRLHRRGDEMQTTVLAHEVWIRIRESLEAGEEGELRYAARAIRAVLVDEARKAGAVKRGGAWRRIELDGVGEGKSAGTIDLLDLDEALKGLERMNARAARIVELRFFGGLGVRETAELLGIGDRTVESELRLARAILRVRLEGR